MTDINQFDNTSADWNVDDYYDPTLPPDHWALKKVFIEKHKNDFEKYRLLALASTFINMEFMGARYIPQVEKQIAILTSEVPEIISYRQGRRDHLKRTFVSATDATRSKLLRTDLDIPKKPLSFVPKDQNQPKMNNCNNKTNILSNLSDDDFNLLEKVRYQPGVRGKIVLSISGQSFTSYHVVNQAAIKAKLTCVLQKTGKMDEKCQWEYIITVGDEELARSFAFNDKKAKDSLGPIALKTLQETCFTIVVKSQLVGENIDKSKIKDTQKKHEESMALPQDNKGAKMMRLMGWTGQGLGKNQDGISKPIEATRNVSRMGLRLDENNDIKAIKQVISKVLEDYIKDTEFYNLVFSGEYSKDERKIIHEVAQKLNLKSRSYGKDEERQLVITKKLSEYELVAHLLSCGRENDNYKLLLPTKLTVEQTPTVSEKVSKSDEIMEVSDEENSNQSSSQNDDQTETNNPTDDVDPYKQYRPLTKPEKKEQKRQIKAERCQIREENELKKKQKMLESGQLTQQMLDKKARKAQRKKEKKMKKNEPTNEVKQLIQQSKSRIYLHPENQAYLQKVRNQEGIFGELIIYVGFTQSITDFQLILQSAQKLGLTTTVQPTGLVENELQEYIFKIGKDIIIIDFIKDPTEVQNIMGTKALKYLEQYCFSIIVKSNKRGRLIKRKDILGPNCVMPVKGQLRPQLSQEENNVMKDRITNLFKEYIQSTSPDHIVFDTEFTEKERKSFGKIANGLKLKPMHYGKKDYRKSVVSKMFDRWELVELLLSEGCETISYKLLKPTKIV